MGLLGSFKGEMRCFAASCEVTPRVVSQFPLVTKDRNTHADTRNATKTTAGASPPSPKKQINMPAWVVCMRWRADLEWRGGAGTYVVAHENDGAVREYDAAGAPPLLLLHRPCIAAAAPCVGPAIAVGRNLLSPQSV